MWGPSFAKKRFPERKSYMTNGRKRQMRMFRRDAGFPNRAGISAGLIRRAGGEIAGGGLHSFHGPACRYEIHGIIRGDPQVLEQSRFSMDLHMLVQIRPIKLDCQFEFELPL